jgi:hypothetical protein
MKTAVEWFAGEIKGGKLITNQKFEELLQKAKEMEKQQMWAYIEINYVNGENSLAFHKAEFEQYYNETFNK